LSNCQLAAQETEFWTSLPDAKPEVNSLRCLYSHAIKLRGSDLDTQLSASGFRSDLSCLLQTTYTTRFVGGVSSAVQSPGGASAGTVEQSATATQSCSLSTDTSLEVALIQKPEAARKPVIIQQPTALAPFSQIRAGRGVLFPPLDEPHEGADNRSTAAAYCLFLPEPEIEIQMTSPKCR